MAQLQSQSAFDSDQRAVNETGGRTQRVLLASLACNPCPFSVCVCKTLRGVDPKTLMWLMWLCVLHSKHLQTSAPFQCLQQPAFPSLLPHHCPRLRYASAAPTAAATPAAAAAATAPPHAPGPAPAPAPGTALPLTACSCTAGDSAGTTWLGCSADSCSWCLACSTAASAVSPSIR